MSVGSPCMEMTVAVKSEVSDIARFPEVGFGGVLAVTSQRKINLVIVYIPVTAGSYHRDIIEPIIIPQIHQDTPTCLVMDDNAPLHRARIVGVPHMVLAAMSPDLNPIELIWDQPKQRLDERTPPQVTWQLQIAFTEEWNPLPQNNIIKLVRSVGKRLTNDNISLVLFWIFSNVL